MGGALPPRDGNDGDAGADETFHNRVLKIEDHSAVDAPPRNGNHCGGVGDGGAEKPSRGRTIRARIFLAMGLLFEVSATGWAFQQAVSAGALDGDDVDCGNSGRIFKLYGSYLVADRCDGQIDADSFFNFAGNSSRFFSGSYWDDLVGCDNLTDAVAGAIAFEKLCSCYDKPDPIELTSCSWAAVSNPSEGICFAQGVTTNSSDGTITGGLYTYEFVDGCWATNPSGTAALTITALVVALSSQLLEAFVGLKYWKETEERAAVFTLGASVFEALGVVVVSSVLLSLPGFYGRSDDTFYRLHVLFGLAWAAVPIAIVGAVAEITVEFSERAARRLRYLGAVGNALIWLSAGLLEVVVTSYLLWTGAGLRGTGDIAREIAGLFVLELLGLVSMSMARFLWTRAKLLRASVKRLEEPLRKRGIYLRFK